MDSLVFNIKHEHVKLGGNSVVVTKQKLEMGMGDGLLQTHHKYGGNSQKIKILAHTLLSLEPNQQKA